ncbi:MAG: hypothetical protein QOG68_688, partial [Solirubrobacteraceae bacterium]|nr:hypothetical protein [Solirubrobacteraceae bacterium]
MASRRPLLRSVLPPVLVIVGVALLVHLAYDPWYLNYDTRWALDWAHDFWHGFSPEYTADFAPTPHPLWTAVASLALLFGDHADDAMAWLVMLSFGTLVWLTYRLGAELFNRWAGAVAAIVVLTRPAMQRDVLLGYLDIPFATLIVGAVLLEVRRPRRGAAVLVVLAVAGLLRPEAWALAVFYVLYLWRGLSPRDRARYAGLALLAPAIWFTTDAIVTGDALHSLHGTADLADENNRRRTLGEVPYWTLQYFGFTLRLPILLGIPVGLWFAWRRGIRRSHLPLVVGLLLVAGFAIGPIFGLPLIGRYIRTPSVLLAVFYGAACFGWLNLAPSKERFRWGLAGLLCIGLSVAYIPSLSERLDGLRGRRDREAKLYGDLRRLAHAPAVERAFRACPRISASDHRPIPYLRFWLRGRPGSVSTTEKGASPLAP